MAKEKDKKITIANLLAMCGLAGLGVITFLGAVLKSKDGQIGEAVITAVVIVAVFALLLFLMIKAKRAESDVAKWKIAEYVLLGIYIVAAIGLSGPFFKFFHVSFNRVDLYNDAEYEIHCIQELYINYDKMIEDEMNISQQNMINYVQSGTFNYELRKYMNDMGIPRNDVAGWFKKAKAACKMRPDSTLNEMKTQILNWDFMELSQCAYMLTQKGEEVASAINAKMKENLENKRMPRIIGRGTGYELVGFVEREFEAPTTGNFLNNLNKATGFTIEGLIILILLHLIVLLNYLVTRRSRMVMPNAMKMGIDLFN